MPVRWLGPKATYHGNIDKPAVTCTPNPQRNDSVPTTAQMTDKAIELLSKMRKAFSCKLKVRQSINRIMLRILVGKLARRSISMKPYNGRWNSLKEGNTLVIVTADHAHASQIVAPDTKAPGLTCALNTKDGAVMVMSYGTPKRIHKNIPAVSCVLRRMARMPPMLLD